MSTNTFLIDAATRHQIFIQRFAGGEVNAAISQLERLRLQILERMGRETTPFQGQRLSVMLSDLDGLIDRFYFDLTAEIRQRQIDFATEEARFTASMMGEATTVTFQVPASTTLQSVVLREGMDAPVGPSRLTINEGLSRFATKKREEVLRAINDGVLLGETNDQIRQRVSELVQNRHANQANSLIRTITNHTASQARAMVYEENAGIVDRYEWVATLDARTTLVCGGRDGRTYPVGRGPMPPAHWGCRSTTIPIVADQYTVARLKGERPAVGPDGAEQVSGQSTYAGWLRKQPAEFQDEVLGEARGKLFRQGGLSIDRFRDETGRVYTLEQLAQLEPLAFQRANVDV